MLGTQGSLFESFGLCWDAFGGRWLFASMTLGNAFHSGYFGGYVLFPFAAGPGPGYKPLGLK